MWVMKARRPSSQQDSVLTSQPQFTKLGNRVYLQLYKTELQEIQRLFCLTKEQTSLVKPFWLFSTDHNLFLTTVNQANGKRVVSSQDFKKNLEGVIQDCSQSSACHLPQPWQNYITSQPAGNSYLYHALLPIFASQKLIQIGPSGSCF